MTEELAQKANEALIEIINGAIATKEFVIEQAPDVVEQLLMWHMTMSLVWFSLGALLAASMIWFIAALIRACRENAEEGVIFALMDGTEGGILAAPIILTPISIVVAFANLSWLQILIAPKLYLIEYAANLVK